MKFVLRLLGSKRRGQRAGLERPSFIGPEDEELVQSIDRARHFDSREAAEAARDAHPFAADIEVMARRV